MVPAGRRKRKKRRSQRPKMDLEALTLRNLSNFIKFEGHEAMLSQLLDELMPHTSLTMHSCDQIKA